MGKTFDGCMKEINDDSGDGQYSFGALFDNLEDGDDELLEGNCVLFSMTEKTARAINDMRESIPKGNDSVKINMPPHLKAAVRYALGSQERALTPIAKGSLNDTLIGDGCYLDKNDVHIRVTRDGVAIEVFAEAAYHKDINVTGIARIPGNLLIDAMEEAMNTPPEQLLLFADRLFTEESAPAMSLR